METTAFWDDELEELSERMDGYWPKVDADVAKQNATNPDADSWENKMKPFTPAEWKRLAGASNGGYHYLGAAKILAPIGKSFAEALVGRTAAKYLGSCLDTACSGYERCRKPVICQLAGPRGG